MDLPETLTDRVVHGLRRALARARRIDDAVLVELGLPERHYAVLALLQDGPVARQHELAALGFDRSHRRGCRDAGPERGRSPHGPHTLR